VTDGTDIAVDPACRPPNWWLLKSGMWMLAGMILLTLLLFLVLWGRYGMWDRSSSLSRTGQIELALFGAGEFWEAAILLAAGGGFLGLLGARGSRGRYLALAIFEVCFGLCAVGVLLLIRCSPYLI
jgi:hypothetical protein